MSYTEKIDFLELLINIIKDHEAKLDELVGRLEAVAYAVEDDGHETGLPQPKQPEPKVPKQISLSERELMRRFYE